MLTNKLSVAIADKVIVLSKLKEAEEAHGAVEGGRVNCAVHVGDALGDITAMRAENESLRSMVHMFHHLNPKACPGCKAGLPAGRLCTACVQIAEWEPQATPAPQGHILCT